MIKEDQRVGDSYEEIGRAISTMMQGESPAQDAAFKAVEAFFFAETLTDEEKSHRWAAFLAILAAILAFDPKLFERVQAHVAEMRLIAALGKGQAEVKQ